MGSLRLLLIFQLVVSSSFAYTKIGNVYFTDGTRNNVNDAVINSSPGDIIDIPVGKHTWTDDVTLSTDKHITFRGQKAGRARLIAVHEYETIETGSKTWDIDEKITAQNFQIGDIVRAQRTGERTNWMQGDVTAISDTNITINVTNTSGSGSEPTWHFFDAEDAASMTIIEHNNTTNEPLISITEATTGNTIIEGIRFVRTGTPTHDNSYVRISHRSNAEPVIIGNCFFERTFNTGNPDTLYFATNRGLVHDCTLTSLGHATAGAAFHCIANSLTSSWSSPSTMGSADPNGKSNLYIEDCSVHAWLSGTDFDSNIRSVIRYCVLDHSGIGSHGADTSNIGVRHFEVYNNKYWYAGYSDGNSINMTRFHTQRGGTGLVANGVFNVTDGNDYAWVNLWIGFVFNLRRNAGPHPCWGAGDGDIPDEYPAPRQVGLGYITGTTDVPGLGGNNDAFAYLGDFEPVYIWGNTGANIGNMAIGGGNYSPDECGGGDSIGGYIQSGRDFILSAKPGWSPYTYPHTLRSVIPASAKARRPAQARRAILSVK